MKRLGRFATCTLFVTFAFCGPAPLLAQNRIPSPKLNVSYVPQGLYHCDDCNIVIDVPANGIDQRPVAYANGHEHDTIQRKIIDPETIEVTIKSGDRIYLKQIITAASDGKTLYVKTSAFSESSERPATDEMTAVRIGAPLSGVSGAHAVSGSWRVIKRVSVDEN